MRNRTGPTANLLAQAPNKGSVLRGPGRSLVGIGPTAQHASLAAGASVTLTMKINEPGILDRLFLSSSANGSLVITAMTLGGDALISGQVSGSVFDKDAVNSPLFGHKVDTNTALEITFLNVHDAAAVTNIVPSFSVV